MKTVSEDDLKAMTPAQAAKWVFNTNPDLRNPYERDSWPYHQFNAEIFKLECENRGY